MAKVDTRANVMQPEKETHFLRFLKQGLKDAFHDREELK